MSTLTETLRAHRNRRPEAITEEAAAPEPIVTPAPVKPQGRAGKSSDPNYERRTVYFRSDLIKQATRKYEDENKGDMSDLCEHLLKKYLGA